MTEFDKEIVKAASDWADWVNAHGAEQPAGTVLRRLVDAVAAKREAERPKLLTVEEALEIDDGAIPTIADRNSAYAGMRAVLTEERKRSAAVYRHKLKEELEQHFVMDGRETNIETAMHAFDAAVRALQPKS